MGPKWCAPRSNLSQILRKPYNLTTPPSSPSMWRGSHNVIGGKKMTEMFSRDDPASSWIGAYALVNNQPVTRMSSRRQ